MIICVWGDSLLFRISSVIYITSVVEILVTVIWCRWLFCYVFPFHSRETLFRYINTSKWSSYEFSTNNLCFRYICLQLRPNFADAWSNLASAYMRKGRLNEAGQCCRQALALNSRLVNLHH